MSGGEGRIRTSVGISQQIYSLPRLAASVPLLLFSVLKLASAYSIQSGRRCCAFQPPRARSFEPETRLFTSTSTSSTEAAQTYSLICSAERSRSDLSARSTPQSETTKVSARDCNRSACFSMCRSCNLRPSVPDPTQKSVLISSMTRRWLARRHRTPLPRASVPFALPASPFIPFQL